MRTLDISHGGARVAVEEDGTGVPVLLAHAGVTDRRVWDATVPRLVAAGCRTIRYDLPGFGRSTRATEPFSLVQLALAVLDALEVPDAHFVGLSQGAATSLDTALAAPERVRDLTLIAPGLSGYAWPRLPGSERRMAAAERDDAHGLAVEIARLWAPMSFDAGCATDDAAHIVIDQAEQFMADELEVEEPSAVDRLGDVRVPTLIVLGDRDVDAVRAIGDLLAAGIPGARKVRLEGADHLLPVRVPDALHALLVEHLRLAPTT